MKILIVSATEKEIAPLFDLIGLKPINDIRFYQNMDYKEHYIDILITGVGMVATTFWLSKVLHENTYQLAINAGICGSFRKDYKLGETVIINCEAFSDFGYIDENSFETIFELNLMDKNELPYNDGVLRNKYHFTGILNELPKLKGITSNTMHGDSKRIENLMHYFQPDVETMEGAAFFYCCIMDSTKFIELRAISNYVEKRDTTKWNINLAIKNLNQSLKKMLDEEKIL